MGHLIASFSGFRRAARSHQARADVGRGVADLLAFGGPHNFTHCIARSLLEAGAFRAPLHPGCEEPHNKCFQPTRQGLAGVSCKPSGAHLKH
jgi:hypothetical protein